MFFFPCSCKILAFRKKKEGKTKKNFTDFARTRELRKDRKRVLKLGALHTTHALFVALRA